MLEWLGIDRYNALEDRARTYKERSDAVLECMAFLEGSKLSTDIQ